MDMQETARTQEGRVHVHVWWGGCVCVKFILIQSEIFSIQDRS